MGEWIVEPLIEVDVIGESGYEQAMFGMGLSFGLTSGMSFKEFSESSSIDDQEKRKRMTRVLEANASKDGGHNKYLESIQLWFDINAPRYWWSEFDTYRVGTSKQSESTVHTLVKQMEKLVDDARVILDIKDGDWELSFEKIKEYYVENFEHLSDSRDLFPVILDFAQKIIKTNGLKDFTGRLMYAKGILTESYLQRRIVSLNYKVMRNIVLQRYNHKLPHWKMFIDDVSNQLEHPELIKVEMKMFGGLKTNCNIGK